LSIEDNCNLQIRLKDWGYEEPQMVKRRLDSRLRRIGDLTLSSLTIVLALV
jgi:hypothetical protein